MSTASYREAVAKIQAQLARSSPRDHVLTLRGRAQAIVDSMIAQDPALAPDEDSEDCSECIDDPTPSERAASRADYERDRAIDDALTGDDEYWSSGDEDDPPDSDPEPREPPDPDDVCFDEMPRGWR